MAGEADWDGYFELGPEHTPGAPWYALQLKVPGHKGRVRVCATMVRRASPVMRGPQLTPNGLGPGWSLSQPPPAR